MKTVCVTYNWSAHIYPVLYTANGFTVGFVQNLYVVLLFATIITLLACSATMLPAQPNMPRLVCADQITCTSCNLGELSVGIALTQARPTISVRSVVSKNIEQGKPQLDNDAVRKQ